MPIAEATREMGEGSPWWLLTVFGLFVVRFGFWMRFLEPFVNYESCLTSDSFLVSWGIDHELQRFNHYTESRQWLIFEFLRKR